MSVNYKTSRILYVRIEFVPPCGYLGQFAINMFVMCGVFKTHPLSYTPSQRGNYHHSMFHSPTAAVNLFHVGKQYLTLCKAEAAVTRNLIGRKIISNVKHADARNSLPILDVIRSSDKRHSVSEYCK